MHLDLLGFQSQTNARFDKVDGRLDKVEGRLDRVERPTDARGGSGQLREELPTVVGDVMREVLREQKR